MFNNNANGYTLSDIAAVTGNGGGNNGNGNGGGLGFNGDGAWIILLFIIILLGGGWNGNGNGFGGGSGNGGGGFGGGYVPYFFNTTSDLQRGFDQQTLTSGIAGLQSGIYGLSTQLCNTGSDIQQALCSGFGGVNSNMNAGFANAETAATARQMANMNQAFASQTAMSQGFNQLSSQFADCCCENRLGTADLKYTIATENCADRAAVSDGIRDVITAGTANTQAMLNAIKGLSDQMCQDKIDAKNEKIADLERQLTMADLRASQIAQTAQIQAGQVAEIDAMYQRLRDCPVPSMPVYGSQPIFTCPGNNGNGCGCSGNTFYN